VRKILVTGIAGFIGFHVSKLLAKDKNMEVYGIDVLNDYYDPELKKNRLLHLGFDAAGIESGAEIQSATLPIRFKKINLADKAALLEVFESFQPDGVVHLAAQAGVRYSLTHPEVYMESNMTAFLNMLEACRFHAIQHLVYASSSSVYGLNGEIPFSVKKGTNHPVSLYAATKKSNELMAHCYSHLYQIPTTGLRFFTVYGPWGRPDMALFLFTKAILEGKAIDVYNHGKMRRDFTYIDDIVQGIYSVLMKPATPSSEFNPLRPKPDASSAPYRVLNIGHSKPVELMDFVHEIERQLGKKAELNLMPLQPGDVLTSYADVTELVNEYGYRPSTSIEVGVERFIRWYRDYYKV
jgi:UDP-glucuronate 4-epimerase